MPGVIRLTAGDYDDGRPMSGPLAHTDIVNAPSDSWRTILAVITGDGLKTLDAVRGSFEAHEIEPSLAAFEDALSGAAVGAV